MSDRSRPALDALLQDLTEVVDPASARTVRNLIQRWARGRVRVLLLGGAKRGKSTVGNALLRREVLPAGVVPLTAVTTIVRPGSRFLHGEAERMLGKHIGRGRSDFQIQIHRIDAELSRQAAASCAARRAQLLRATHAAEQATGGLTTEGLTTDDCSDERLSRLHLLADRLDKLRGTAQPSARDVTP